MSRVCPACGALQPVGGLCLPLGLAVALLGGLAVVAAFFMPWFATQQGLIMTGQFLAQFLGNTSDLRRFVPGASGGSGEVLALRGLVYLFPACGALAALLALAGLAWPDWRGRLRVGLLVLGLAPLVALAGGVTRLPPGSSLEVGLGLIGLGAVVVLIGTALDARAGA